MIYVSVTMAGRYFYLVLTLWKFIAVASECLPPNERFDCHPEPGSTPEKCEARGCCYEATRRDQPNVPSCSFPQNYGGYETVNITTTENGQLVFMKRSFSSAYPKDVEILRVESEYLTGSILRIKISDANQQRYESPYPRIQKPTVEEIHPKYKVDFSDKETGFKVTRLPALGTGDIFNAMNVGAFIFADQFLEISTLLTQGTVLSGIGEQRTNITLKLDWKRYTLFNHDIPPGEDINLYGAHPFYIATDSSKGLSHGVFLHNSNAMEILTSPQPALTFRTIGGILDFYFFLGPKPEDVVKQYTSIIGRTFLPPYWSLGFHLCRHGYGSTKNTRAIWERNRALKIPYDVQWNDIDYMINNNGFTIDPNNFGDLPEFVQDVHDSGMHYIPIVDPGISGTEPNGTYPPFDLGAKQDVLVKHKNGSIFYGRVWNPVSTAWPDFTHPGVQDYWNELLSDFHDKLPFDGIWIDMNEPSNFLDGTTDGCPQDNLENPPYTPGVLGDKLSYRTFCMNAQHAAGSHYDLHNLYGIYEAEVTNKALRKLGKRPLVISRSTFAGSGQYTGHWSGDNEASWYDLKKSIPEILTFNMYGIPFVGADICGFRENTNKELCNRWFQLGAFYPFCRNHNSMGLIDQDPAAFGDDNETIRSIRLYLSVRYQLLPYLYTLLYKSHVEGSTVAKPVYFVFPDDPKTYDVENAFFWGEALYIIPVVEPGVTSVEAYLPEGRWFDINSGFEIYASNVTTKLDAPYDRIPLLARGGYILPLHSDIEAVTTASGREGGLMIAVFPSSEEKAEGLLYWDDGEVIDPVENDVYGLVKFTYDGSSINCVVQHWTTEDVPKVVRLLITGFNKSIEKVMVNGVPAYDWAQETDRHYLGAYFEGVPLNTNITIVWE